MKWFQHDCDAINDIKIKKLVRKFGIAGYGLFFVTLELIGQKMEHHIKDFGYLPAEYTNEEIGILSGLSPDTVGTIYEYMIEIGLFEKKNGKLYNDKIKGRCDEYTARLIKKKYITPDNVPIVSRHSPDSVAIEEKRIEEKRIEKEMQPLVTTPSQKMKEFLLAVKEKNDKYLLVVDSIEQKGAPRDVIEHELAKFCSYWTEKNKSGTKERWEIEKTFEVQKRLANWFRNVKQFSPKEREGGLIL